MDVTLASLPDFAKDFVATLPGSRGDRAHVIGLSGELGAGKTTLVQAIASELGATRPVVSPTFVFAQRYAIQHAPFTSLVHVDAYRLKPGEAHTIGWQNFLHDPSNLILVEWPEHMQDDFPTDAPVLTFTVVDAERRVLDYARH